MLTHNPRHLLLAVVYTKSIEGPRQLHVEAREHSSRDRNHGQVAKRDRVKIIQYYTVGIDTAIGSQDGTSIVCVTMEKIEVT